MSFLGKGEGNSRERLNTLELRMNRLEGVLRVYGTLFEVLSRYFKEIATLNSGDAAPHKQDSGIDSPNPDQS